MRIEKAEIRLETAKREREREKEREWRTPKRIPSTMAACSRLFPPPSRPLIILPVAFSLSKRGRSFLRLACALFSCARNFNYRDPLIVRRWGSGQGWRNPRRSLIKPFNDPLFESIVRPGEEVTFVSGVRVFGHVCGRLYEGASHLKVPPYVRDVLPRAGTRESYIHRRIFALFSPRHVRARNFRVTFVSARRAANESDLHSYTSEIYIKSAI